MAEQKTVTIDASNLPEGMTPEKLQALIDRAANQTATSEKQRKVRNYAVGKLTKKYEAEYNVFREEGKAKYDAGEL